MNGNIVFPGQAVADKPLRLNYCYVEKDKTYATVLSMQGDDGRIVPLCGPYEPLVDDYIVAFVSEVRFSGYNLAINSPFSAYLSGREVAAKLQIGDVLYCRINTVDEVKSMEMGDARVLRGGTLLQSEAAKVPRIIGKKNSMIDMISRSTGCEIYVGRNGMIWVSEKGDSRLAVDAIHKVEREAHISGLTDRINTFLTENKDRK